VEGGPTSNIYRVKIIGGAKGGVKQNDSVPTKPKSDKEGPGDKKMIDKAQQKNKKNLTVQPVAATQETGGQKA